MGDEDDEYLAAAIAASLLTEEEDQKKRKKQSNNTGSKEFIPKYLAEIATPGVNYFTTVPNELIILVFTFLGLKDLMKISMVCKTWNTLAEDDSLWKPIYKKKYVLFYPFNNINNNSIQHSTLLNSNDDNNNSSNPNSKEFLDSNEFQNNNPSDENNRSVMILTPKEVKQEFSRNLYQSKSVQDVLNSSQSSSSSSSNIKNTNSNKNSSPASTTTDVDNSSNSIMKDANIWKSKYTCRQNWTHLNPFSSQTLAAHSQSVLSLSTLPSSPSSLLTLTPSSLSLLNINNNNHQNSNSSSKILIPSSTPTLYYTHMVLTTNRVILTTHTHILIYSLFNLTKPIHTIPIPSPPSSICYSSLHSRLFLRTQSLSFHIYDLGSASGGSSAGGAGSTTSSSSSSSSTSGGTGTIREIYKGRSSSKGTSMYVHNNMLITGYDNRKIKVYDLQTGGRIKNMYGHSSGVVSIEMDNMHFGHKLLSGGVKGDVKVWDIRGTGGVEKTVDIKGRLSSVRWGGGGDHDVFMAGGVGGIHLWSLNSKDNNNYYYNLNPSNPQYNPNNPYPDLNNHNTLLHTIYDYSTPTYAAGTKAKQKKAGLGGAAAGTSTSSTGTGGSGTGTGRW